MHLPRTMKNIDNNCCTLWWNGDIHLSVYPSPIPWQKNDRKQWLQRKSATMLSHCSIITRSVANKKGFCQVDQRLAEDWFSWKPRRWAILRAEGSVTVMVGWGKILLLFDKPHIKRSENTGKSSCNEYIFESPQQSLKNKKQTETHRLQMKCMSL